VLCGEHADEQVPRPVLEVADATFELVNLRSSERWRFVGMRPLCTRNDRHLAGLDSPRHPDDDAIVPESKSIRNGLIDHGLTQCGSPAAGRFPDLPDDSAPISKRRETGRRIKGAGKHPDRAI
jgi:hypothetical protein